MARLSYQLSDFIGDWTSPIFIFFPFFLSDRWLLSDYGLVFVAVGQSRWQGLLPSGSPSWGWLTKPFSSSFISKKKRRKWEEKKEKEREIGRIFCLPLSSLYLLSLHFFSLSFFLLSLSWFFLSLHKFFFLGILWISGGSRSWCKLDQLIDPWRGPRLIISRFFFIIFSFLIADNFYMWSRLYRDTTICIISCQAEYLDLEFIDWRIDQ